jgi:hypothetical protein
MVAFSGSGVAAWSMSHRPSTEYPVADVFQVGPDSALTGLHKADQFLAAPGIRMEM